MQSIRLVYVKFLDHVIFKEMRPRVRPVVRETIGWIISEDQDAITLLWVREPEKGSPQVRRATGICILKSDIVELREVRIT